MNEQLVGGFGLGAIITFIATRIMAVIEKDLDHRLAMQKTFFERKLQVAEEMIGWYGTIGSALRTYCAMSKLFKENEIMDSDILTAYRNEVINRIDKYREADIRSAESLYFDINIDEGKQLKKDLQEKLTEIAVAYHKIDGLVDSGITDMNEHSKLLDVVDMDSTYNQLEQATNYYDEIIRRMRTEIEDYYLMENVGLLRRIYYTIRGKKRNKLS